MLKKTEIVETPEPVRKDDKFGYQPSIERGYQPTKSLDPLKPPRGGSGVPQKPAVPPPAPAEPPQPTPLPPPDPHADPKSD